MCAFYKNGLDAKVRIARCGGGVCGGVVCWCVGVSAMWWRSGVVVWWRRVVVVWCVVVRWCGGVVVWSCGVVVVWRSERAHNVPMGSRMASHGFVDPIAACRVRGSVCRP